MIGVDIDANLVERARRLIASKGQGGPIEFRLVEPGPLDFADASFDLVYSSGAFTQIADKRGMFREVRRVLKPGGWLAAYDWMKGPNPIGADMRYFFKMEGLTYAMETPDAHARLLTDLGFEAVRASDDGGWYRDQAHAELKLMKGKLKAKMAKLLGKEQAAHFVENWRAMTVVLDSGELRPGRYRARNRWKGEGPRAWRSNRQAASSGLGAKGPKAERGRPGKIVAGKPVTTTRNFSIDPTGKFFCGIWTSSKGKWAIEYREEEFVYMISGKCRLIDAGGRSQTFKAGDAFVIPSGFKGFWETLRR